MPKAKCVKAAVNRTMDGDKVKVREDVSFIIVGDSGGVSEGALSLVNTAESAVGSYVVGKLYDITLSPSAAAPA